MLKNLPAMQEIWVQSLGWEDFSGEGSGNLLQYSCLENSMDRGVWQATYSSCGRKESDTTESHTHTHIHTQKELTVGTELSTYCLH